MQNIDINNLDIFQLHSLREILDNRAEYYTKSIPNYALLATNGTEVTPEQRNMLQKYNIIKGKSAKITSMIENYILKQLFEDEED